MECVFRPSYLSHILICDLELIKTSFPWLWEMKELISERPNVNPVGLGNNSSSIDMDTFVTGYSSEVDDTSVKLEREGSELMFDDDFDDEDEGEDDELTLAIPKKRPANSIDKKTPARPGKSKPATLDSKKAKVIDRFADVAAAEEVTAQKTLELRKMRAHGEVAKIRARADLQMQRERLKAETRMLEKRQEHEYRMAQLNLRLPQQGYTGSTFSRASSSSASANTSFNPSFDFDNPNYDLPLDDSLRLPHPSMPVNQLGLPSLLPLSRIRESDQN
jgi:hypothetical protein